MPGRGGADDMGEASRRFDEEPDVRSNRLVRAVRSTVGTLGISAAPAPLRWLSAVEIAAAAMLVTVLLVAGSGGLPDPSWLVGAFAAVLIAFVAQLSVRVGAGVVRVAWGEAAMILVLYAVPRFWAPAVILVGVLTSQVLRGLFAERHTALYMVRNSAMLALAGGAATLASAAVADTYQVSLTPTVALALGTGALAYTATSMLLVAASVAARQEARFIGALLSVAKSKLLMVVGNILVGLFAVFCVSVGQPLWLLTLPPGLWLLQQTYIHRLRADDERRTWQAFAGATKALNQLDETGVVDACLTGARTLFAPDEVELVVTGSDGLQRRYLADKLGLVRSGHAARPGVESGEVATRVLMVGRVPVGELTLRFTQQVPLTPRQQAAFSAYGDALAAALHDAATHRELQAVSARSAYESSHDSLTGLANRAALLTRGDNALRLLERDTPVALLLLDINHFKEVNDTLGHAAGDELLRVVASRLGDLAQPGELVARLGGDEFALLLTSLPDEASGPTGDRPQTVRYAVRRARQLTESLAAPMEVAGVTLSVEASVGVVVSPAAGADMTELLRRADIAMYQAREAGGSVSWYDSAKDAASTDRLAMLAELREALAAGDQLILVLQPAVDLTTGGPTGVEALARWRHPRRGMLTPVDFVRVIEDSELLGTFTRYVLDRALSIAADWARQDMDVPIAVNVSPRALLDPHLPADVAELLKRHRVPSHRLVLEITETVVMSELAVIDEVLNALRDMGVQLAVDDFGTGYSSLTFLTRIPVDEVKVDRTFVARMVDSPEAAAIVRTTVDLGKELGLRVIAEGVETAEQRAALTALGCTAAQGYHFFPPLPAEKVAVVLRALQVATQARVIHLRADGAS